jgi:hypothetical protein
MISNFDIEKICSKLDLPIVGVFNKDTLPPERAIGSYYINLQNHDDGDGTHWVFAKIYSDDQRKAEEIIATDREGTQVVRCDALYFDPFGVDMPQEVAEFLKPFKPIPFNNRQIQNIRSEVCGWYCLACDYCLEHKQHSKSYLEDYEKFLALWDDRPNKNLPILKSLFRPL